MNTVQVYDRKSFKNGFVLNEAEVRRIVQIIKEQLLKANDKEQRITYKITFESGTVVDTKDIEEVINQENGGSLLIVDLSIDASVGELDVAKSTPDEKERYEHEIYLRFTNTDSDRMGGTTSMYYFISGKTRDWVMVTKQIIDEKFEKIKLRAIKFHNIVRYVVIILLLSSIFSLVYFYDFANPSQNLLNQKGIELLKNENITNNDLLNYVIEKNKLEVDNQRFIRWAWYVFSIAIFLLAYMSDNKFSIKKLYPQYNFCWGEHEKVFERKKNLANNIFWGVIIAFILGVIVNLITNK